MMRRLALLLGIVSSGTALAEDKLALNTGYEHYADIVFATGFVEGTGNYTEVVTNTQIGVPSGEARGTDGTYEEYVSTTLDSSDEVDWGDNAAWDGLAAATVACLVRNNKTAIASTGAEAVFAKEGAGNDSFRASWAQNENFAAVVYIGATGYTATLSGVLGTTVTATNWNLLGFTWDGSNIVARVNNDQTTGVAASGTMNATAHTLKTSDDNSGSTNAWDGDNAMCVILDVALDDTDWDALVSDPLQIFAADAGGGGANLLDGKFFRSGKLQ